MGKIKLFLTELSRGVSSMALFPSADYNSRFSSAPKEETRRVNDMPYETLFIADDGEALRSDWQAVGNDLRWAIRKYEPQNA